MGIFRNAWRAWTHADARDELEQLVAEHDRLNAARKQHTAQLEEAQRQRRDAAQDHTRRRK